MGFPLAWLKGQWGSEVEWIGAKIAIRPGGASVEVMLPEKKRLDMQQRLRDLLGTNRVPRGQLRQLAGFLSWVTGLMPQLQTWRGR